jgi:hypothetical protein
MDGPANAYQGGQYASAFQDATNAQSAMAREDFQQDLGGQIGGLNAIGALRSGRASTTIDNASRTFGRQIGNIAAANAGELARLNQSTAEGEANRGVQRDGMAMQDRQFGQRLQFDTDGRAMDNSFRQDRAGRSDMESDRSFGFQRERANRDDFNTDRSFNASEDQRGRDNTYRDGRASRSDMESDRGFNRGVLESDRTFGFNQDRANRSDMESDRSFGFNKERAGRADFESDRGFTYNQGRDQVGDQRDQRNYDRGVMESDRSFGENQRQFNVGTDMARTQARQAGQAQVWSSAVNLGAQALTSKAGKAALGKVAGGVAGKLGGAKVGAMLGSVIPGAGTLVGAGLGLVGGKVLGKIGGGIKKLFGR